MMKWYWIWHPIEIGRQESDNLVDNVFFPHSEYVQYQTDARVNTLFQNQEVYWMRIVLLGTSEFIINYEL